MAHLKRRAARRFGLLHLAGVLVFVCVGLVASPATAASSSGIGQILIKSANSGNYSYVGDETAAVGAFGATVQHSVEVRNLSYQSQTFWVHAVTSIGWTTSVTSNYLPVDKGTDLWWQVTIPGSGVKAYTVSVTLPKSGSAYLTGGTDFSVWQNNAYSADSSATLISEVSAAGSGPDVLTATQASQKPIGGATTDQYIAAPAISQSQTATYTVTVKNTTTSTAYDSMRLSYSCPGYKYQFLQAFPGLTGTTYRDVTAQVEGSTGAGFTLGLNKSQAFKVNVTVDTSSPMACATGQGWIQAGVWDGSSPNYTFDQEDALLTNINY